MAQKDGWIWFIMDILENLSCNQFSLFKFFKFALNYYEKPKN